MIDLNPGSTFRKILNEEFFSPKNDCFRKWYFEFFSKKELEYFENQYNSYMEETGDYSTFDKWFLSFFAENQEKEILTLQKSWQTIRGEILNSPFPPEQTIILNKDAEASVFLNLQKLENSHVTIKELNFSIKSQNYTNTYLICLGDQFISLDEKNTFY